MFSNQNTRKRISREKAFSNTNKTSKLTWLKAYNFKKSRRHNGLNSNSIAIDVSEIDCCVLPFHYVFFPIFLCCGFDASTCSLSYTFHVPHYHKFYPRLYNWVSSAGNQEKLQFRRNRITTEVHILKFKNDVTKKRGTIVYITCIFLNKCCYSQSTRTEHG